VTSADDFLPTICKLAGVDLPKELKSDGEDFSDIWMGKSRPRSKALHWEWSFGVQGAQNRYMSPAPALHDRNWKLFVNHDERKAQLFNISKDPGEELDLALQNP
jgi:arylsulfatase A-like enzyme